MFFFFLMTAKLLLPGKYYANRKTTKINRTISLIKSSLTEKEGTFSIETFNIHKSVESTKLELTFY